MTTPIGDENSNCNTAQAAWKGGIPTTQTPISNARGKPPSNPTSKDAVQVKEEQATSMLTSRVQTVTKIMQEGRVSNATIQVR